MQAREINWAVPAGSDNAIALNQAPAANALFNLNGAIGIGSLASGDVTDRVAGGCSQRQVIITCAADETGHSVLITGRRAPDFQSAPSDTVGPIIAETVALGTAGIFSTLQDWEFIISAQMLGGAATGNIKIGTNGVARTPWQALQLEMRAPFAVGLCATLVSGSATFGYQHTFERLPKQTGATSTLTGGNSKIPVPYDHSSLKALTASTDGNYAFPVSAIRGNNTVGAGVVRYNYIQAGIIGGGPA